MRGWSWWWIAVVLWVGCRSSAPQAPARRSQLSLPIQAFRVANNGLRVILVPDPKASEVQVAMRYGVGAIDEPAGREGIAHLAEHLMFLQQLGAGPETLQDRLEATASWFNAFTGLETTAYVARADPSRLAELLQLEGLRLGLRCKTLTDEAFLRERDVVRNELRQRAGDLRDRAALIEALYPEGHLYRRDAVFGEEVVAQISREEACAFIEAHYSPDNAVLIVSGAVKPADVDAALDKLLGRVAKHAVAPRPAVAPLAPRAPVTRKVNIDEPVALVVWPLDTDPAMRARMRAVASMMEHHIDSQIKGAVRVLELGAARAPAIGFAIRPGKGEDVAAAVAAAERAALAMQVWFEPEAFQGARARAAYSLFARFEDGNDRDALLSDHVFAGRDPVQGLGAELGALDRLSADEARDIVQDSFAFSSATVVTLVPEASRRPAAPPTAAGTPAAPHELIPRLHRPGEPRVRADPSGARAEAPRTLSRAPLAGIRERTLANGLRVILMPLTSTPTVDVRLVFGAGTIDEPERARGAAYVAAHALAPRRADLEELRAFYVAGGSYGVTVDTDHTTFAARGLDMYVDVLLAGLERLVRHGRYRDGRVELRVEGDAEDSTAEQWRAALYGPAHPYTRADDWRRARFDKLDRGAVVRFRAAHFQPRAATLIVAGGFDPDLADRWIDHLFADWEGAPAPARAAEPAKLQPVALALHEDFARQVAVNIALPVPGGGRAARLIAARMIDAAIADVRAQLGASYGLHAELAEARLATHVAVGGFVAAERAEEALALVRDRIGRLSRGDEVAASLFVAARRDVMAHLAAGIDGASALASLAEAAVDLDRSVGADLATAEDARRLTLDRMAPVLGALDLSRAAILLAGPHDAVTRAFAALGRTPRVVAR